MKNFLYIFILFFCINSFAQKKDSLIVKSSWYARSMPVSLYTGSGFVSDKISQNVEFGRSFGVIDIGITAGRINQRADSNKYVEARVTMDASQYGIFSNEISIGCGKVFKSKTPIMLEISYTVIAQVSKKFGVGIITGYYDFSGNYDDSSKTFYGIFFRYGLLRTENGGLLNKKIRTHHRK